MPEGGPKDEDPPKFIRATPENYTTNFSSDEIRILFDEYVKLEDPQQQIIISPPMDPKPSIMPMGSARKDVKIEIFDTLQENTTYTINFGKSIVDNNEGNPLPYFKYVFSTGDYIDSLAVSGSVEDAYLKAPDEFISIYLYEVDSAFSDSAVFKTTPRYVTYTLDSTNNFTLENLKEGKYQMLAILDKNNNYLYNPKREKIAFLDHYINIPTDSTYTLRLFKEKLPFEPERPKQYKGQQIIFGYEGTTHLDSVHINLLNDKPAGFASRIVKDPEKDTLYYWYAPKLKTDSLSFEVASPAGIDTLYTKIGEVDRDSLKVSAEPSSNINFNEDLVLKATTPLVSYDENYISLLDKDSAAVPFTTELKPLENQLLIKFDKTENNKYQFQALPGAVTDLFDATNDTISKELRTAALADYGKVILHLQNVQNYPILVQLTDLKGNVQAEKYSTGGNSFEFKYLKPGKFFIRIIFDRNENGKWDTGDYLEKRQPEKIEYFPDTLDVRANWDINQSFILK